MSCEHDCEKPAAFPKTIENRPGLPQIDYRIGAYAELRARMLHLLDQDPALSGWMHRGPDDPGIALLEGTAVVGDILTFYQQLYANERYLRTAQWRESIAELVRLLGYRLAPGVGGEATFALAVKGEEPVIVPKGFGLKADIEGGSKPAEFESTREITAYPHLSAFSLYRPRETPLSTDGTQIFKVQAAGIPAGLELAEGDRVLLGDPEPGMNNPTRIDNAQVLTVESAWQAFDTLYVKFTTPLKRSGSIHTLKAYKLGESYRHFGHNAPIKTVTPSDSSYSTDDTNYIRSVNGNTAIPDPDLAADAMPLDAEVKNLVAGAYVIVQARLQTSSTSSSSTTRYTLVRKIDAVESASYTWGMVSGASTVLTLDGNLATDGKNYADIRSFTFHEVIGEPFRLRAQEQPTSETSGAGLDFYGTDAQAQLLRGRDLLLMGPDDQVRGVAVTDVQTSSSSSDAERNLFRRLTLDQSVDYADFPIDTPIVTVYGNLVPATQGKTQKEVVLGSGDRRKTFQTFPLSDAPLTYLLDETRTPAQTPELTVYVDGIAWTQVDSFFNYGPGDAVYIVREDDAGKSYVQFGDNKTGRALPSGLNNVTAIFRVGNAANGVLKDGATPSISGKLKDFDKLHLPDAVTVGSPREDGDNARTAAPGKMQSLGRMVSLADIEAEALALPHVLKVRAAWSAPEGFPLVRLTVLTQSGTSADLDAVRDSMRTYNRCRGPARYPIDVVQGVRQYVYLHIEAGFEAARREADVVSAIKGALGLAGEEGDGIDGEDGLFGLKRRQFGQNAHKSQIIAAVQNAPGVTWVNLKAAQNLPLGSPPETDPLALTPPTTEVVHAALACPTSRILVLHTAHLVLSLAKDEIARECSA